MMSRNEASEIGQVFGSLFLGSLIPDTIYGPQTPTIIGDTLIASTELRISLDYHYV